MDEKEYKVFNKELVSDPVAHVDRSTGVRDLMASFRLGAD